MEIFCGDGEETSKGKTDRTSVLFGNWLGNLQPLQCMWLCTLSLSHGFFSQIAFMGLTIIHFQ